MRYGITILAFFVLFPVTSFAFSIVPSEVVSLTNDDRLAVGLVPLRWDETLARAAEAKADDMAEKKYFAHTSPEGKTPWFFFEKSEYQYRFAGENLAIHFTDAKEEELAWMKSEKHRENILSPKYVDIGVAVRELQWEGKTTLIVVQLFGARHGETLGASVVSQTTPAFSEKSVFGVHSEQLSSPFVKISSDKDIKSPQMITWKALLDSSSQNFLESVYFIFLCGFIGLEVISFGIVSSLFYRRQCVINATPM